LRLAVGVRYPVVWQEFFYFINGMGSDALQNISEPYKRINAMQFAGAHQ